MKTIKGLLGIIFVQRWTNFLMLLYMPSVVKASLQLPTLSCKETVNATVYSLDDLCVLCGTLISCDQMLPRAKHENMGSLDTAFEYIPSGLQFETDSNDGDLVKFCVGMLWMDKRHIVQINEAYIRQYMSFAIKNITVGFATVKKECWKKCRPGCEARVFLRGDVLDLPPVAETPDYAAFWEFTSPLLRPDLGWISELRVDGIGRDPHSPNVSSLSGSALRLVSVRGLRDFERREFTERIVDMPRLVSLDLFQVGLKDFSADTFTGCPLVEYLSLSKNRLNKIPSSIRRLKYLISLIIESNLVDFNLTVESFTYLNELRYLSFAGTRITAWQLKIPPLPHLFNLTLSNCDLANTGPEPLEFPSLQFLSLSGNLGISVPANALTKLYSLKNIDISNNSLSEWPTFPKSHFETINLSHNNFTTLQNLGNSGVFVDYIDLSNNKITQWDDTNVFFSCKVETLHTVKGYRQIEKSNKSDGHFHTTSCTRKPWVRHVNLSMNNIVYFTAPMLDSLLALETVDLGGSTIDCNNCQTPLLQQWLSKKGNTTILILGTNSSLPCFLPNELKGLSVQSIQFDDALCRDPTIRLWWGLGLPLTISIGSILILGAGVFFYRTEVAYLFHLAKIRSSSKKKQENDGCIYDAFVCYSGRNRKWTMRRLVPLLECKPECYRLCLFDRDFPLGSHIVTNIVDAIDQSNKVIVVLTKHFIASKWCQWELEMANHKLFGEDREFLVLLELEPLDHRTLPRLLRFLLATRPVVRWPHPETAPRVLRAAAQLRKALGPSLLQCPNNPRSRDEPGTSTSANGVHAPRDDSGTCNATLDENTPLLSAGAIF